MSRTIQVDAHHLGNPKRVVAGAFVDVRFQERLSVARLDADNRQFGARHTLDQSLRHWASFEPYPFDTEPCLRHGLRQILGMAGDLCFSASSSVLFDDAEGGLRHQNIQSGRVLQAEPPP